MDSAILALACGLGMLHALDADHIAAVANLAGHGPSRRHALMARLTRFGAVFIAGIRSVVALGTIGLGTHMLYGG